MTTVEGLLVPAPPANASQALVVNADGSINTALVAPLPATVDASSIDFVAASSGVISAGPATLLEINGYNDSAVLVFVQLYDLVAVPADGVVPVTVTVRALPNSNYFLAFEGGKAFATGIAWSSSTTVRTKTEAGADQLANAQFRV